MDIRPSFRLERIGRVLDFEEQTLPVIVNREAITATNESPIQEKAPRRPERRVSASPTIIGPNTRARLNWIEFIAIAFDRSSGPTSVNGNSAE